MEVTRVTAIKLHDGTRIDVSTEEGGYISGSSDIEWKTMRVSRSGQQMREKLLCDIDYDMAAGKLKLSVYGEKGEILLKQDLPLNLEEKKGE